MASRKRQSNAIGDTDDADGSGSARAQKRYAAALSLPALACASQRRRRVLPLVARWTVALDPIGWLQQHDTCTELLQLAASARTTLPIRFKSGSDICNVMYKTFDWISYELPKEVAALILTLVRVSGWQPYV